MVFWDYCERIREIVVNRPGITGQDICHATKNIIGCHREDAIRYLLENGFIRVEVTPTKGRPKKAYWPGSMPSTVGYFEAGREAVAVYDLTTMSRQQIKDANERRRQLSKHLVDAGLDPMRMLPIPPMPSPT